MRFRVGDAADADRRNRVLRVDDGSGWKLYRTFTAVFVVVIGHLYSASESHTCSYDVI